MKKKCRFTGRDIYWKVCSSSLDFCKKIAETVQLSLNGQSIFVLLMHYLSIPSTIFPEKSPEQPKHERGAEWARRKSDENHAMTGGILQITQQLDNDRCFKPDSPEFRFPSPRGSATWRPAIENARSRAPTGRFPKFLLPRAAGRPQKLKCTKSL